MPPIPVPGPGKGSQGSEDFDEEQLAAYLSGSSVPDHHFGLVVAGSLGAMPSSLPRSALLVPPPPDMHRSFTLGDLESGILLEDSSSADESEPEDEVDGKLDEEGEAAAHAAAPEPPRLLGAASSELAASPGQDAAPQPAPAVVVLEDGSVESGGQSEAWKILTLAAPLSVSNLAGYAISLVAIAAVGRLGEDALAVVVLATSVFNVTGLSVLIGFASAMETFCGQAYGAGRYHLVGLVVQRALLLLTLVAAVVAAAWAFAEPALLALGQDPAISRGVAGFLMRAIPALFCTGIFEALKRYLMAQEAVRPATVVTVVALLLAPLFNWLLIFHLGLGLHGAAYAMDATQATLALLLVLYCVARDRLLAGSPLATWHGFNRKAWAGWGQYCRYALPGVAMLCCEWSTFEVMVLMSGLLPNPSVSVSSMGLCIQTSGLAYMLVTGLACATSVRTSHALGSHQPSAARRATWTAWGLTMCLQTIVGIAITLLRFHWVRLFTESPAVVARTAELLPLFALSLYGDGTNAVLQGLLRGAGRQHWGAVTNLLSYWCCGIPLAAYLAFHRGMGLQGLWWGLVVINTLQGGIMLTMASLFDYEAQANKVAAMLAQAGTHTDADAADPLLAPLLADGAGEAGGSGGAAGASKARKPRRRGAAAHGGHSADSEGVKQRLTRAMLMLLTEGAHQRHVPAKRAREEAELLEP